MRKCSRTGAEKWTLTIGETVFSLPDKHNFLMACQCLRDQQKKSIPQNTGNSLTLNQAQKHMCTLDAGVVSTS